MVGYGVVLVLVEVVVGVAWVAEGCGVLVVEDEAGGIKEVVEGGGG